MAQPQADLQRRVIRGKGQVLIWSTTVNGITVGYKSGMRFGNVEIRPVGGGPGCLLMVALSIALSVLGTIVLNLLLR